MFTIWVGENPSLGTWNYHFVTCPKPFCFYTKQFRLKMKIMCFTADVCPQDWFLQGWEFSYSANGDKNTEGSDGQILRVTWASAKRGRSTQTRGAHWTEGIAIILPTRNFHVQHSANLKWKLSELRRPYSIQGKNALCPSLLLEMFSKAL